MSLFADRFITQHANHNDNASYALDLATGKRVRLVHAAAGSPAEQREWLTACDEQLRIRPATTRIVDYGRVGEARRFEAWIDESHLMVSAAGGDVPRVALLERPAVSALAELFDTADERRVRVAA